ADVEVAEDEIRQIQVGQKAEVTAEAISGKNFAGTVSEIAQQADRARGTVCVKTLLAKDSALKPGLTIKTTFMPEGDATKILIPKVAIDTGSVWVIDASGNLARRKVGTQVAGPETVEITSGLQGGEQIGRASCRERGEGWGG